MEGERDERDFFGASREHEGGCTISWTAGGASGVATARIRTFSIVLSVLGGIIAFFVAIASAFTGLMGIAGIGGDDYYNGANPWDQAQPASAEHTAGSTTWSGNGGVLITLTEQDFANGPLAVNVTQGTLVELYVSDEADVGAAGDYRYPNYLDYLRPDETTILIPTGPVTELWAMAEGDWEISMVPVQAEVITDYFAGQGEKYLIYEGNAVSARVTFEGEGIFFVTVFTSAGQDMPIIESDPLDRRISWDPSTYTVFFIESDASRGAWTFDIDLLADDPPGPDSTRTPAPSDPSNPTPSPSPTP